MTEEQLRAAMRRFIDLGQPFEALKSYNGYLHNSPRAALDEATLALAEQALGALRLVTPRPASTRNRLIIPFTLLSFLCLLFAICSVAIHTSRLRARSNGPGPSAQTKRDVQAMLRNGDALYQTCKYIEALANDSAAYDEAVRQKDDGSAATALTYAGRDEEALGSLREARNRYAGSLAIRRRIGPSISIEYVEEITGGLDIVLGNYADAHNELTDSLARRASSRDGAGVVECQRDLAGLNIAKGNYIGAEVYLCDAATGATALNKPDMIAAIEGQQGKVCLELGNLKQARQLLEKSLAYWSAKSHTRWIAKTECSLSEVRLRCGDIDDALKLSRDSLSLYERVGDRYGAANAEIAEARTLKQAGSSAEAQALLLKALDYARTSGLVPLEQEVRATATSLPLSTLQASALGGS